MRTFSKNYIATAIAILFHTIGLIGMFLYPESDFVRTTPLHLLLMAILLFYTQQKISPAFIVFFTLCVVTGIGVEIIGTGTGLLFGEYKYGTVLGTGLQNVPWIIGVNWFIIMYCCGVAVHSLLKNVSDKLSEEFERPLKKIKALSVIVDGATLAVIMDWLIEPVAIKLGYWQWLGEGNIPLFNYVSWFVISMLLLTAFHFLPLQKQNKFAINLLLIQAMFFLLLRTFL
ncbi:MAG: carotenoid biosynthesis protein [Chitinophagaceae bacterium]|nr:MAG: carotenoid biosynthesis protein [Chitinophagaceae bacterium]